MGDEWRDPGQEVHLDADDWQNHVERIQAWRRAGWAVRVTFLPDVGKMEGYVQCELTWLRPELESPLPRGRMPPHGIGPTVASAVERCAEALERNRR